MGFRYEKLHLDDDAKKKALTDAISVCCKELGIGADVYWSSDPSKYGELGAFSPVMLPTPPSNQSKSQSGNDGNSSMTTAQAAVADAVQTQINNSTQSANTEQEISYITIDPATTPIPTVQEAEDYVLEGNGQYKGYKLGAIFRLAASGDNRAAGWLNWLSTAMTKSENMAWAKFYAEFLRNYYTQEANNAAKGQATDNNNA